MVNNLFSLPTHVAVQCMSIGYTLLELLKFEPRRVRNLTGGGGVANNKGADQPAHPRRLISAFVIRLLSSIIIKFASIKMSIFQQVSLAEEKGLSLDLSETAMTGFVETRPIIVFLILCGSGSVLCLFFAGWPLVCNYGIPWS